MEPSSHPSNQTDVITGEQKIIQRLSPEQGKILQNDIYAAVLHALRLGPKTVDEIFEYIIKEEKKSSNITQTSTEIHKMG